MKPISKNYFITEQIEDLERLIYVLHTEPTIYVKSWNRVHGTSFFHHVASYPIEKLIEMMEAGEFWRCVKKENVKRDSMRRISLETMEAAKRIQNNTPTAKEAAEAMQKFGSDLHTIGDVVDAANKNRPIKK